MSTDMTASSTRPGRCPCCGAPTRPSEQDRNFTLMDAVILIGVSALCFTAIRPMIQMDAKGLWGWTNVLVMTVGTLVAWTPAVLILRLRQPRPPLRRLSRQPGFAAGLAGVTTLGLGALAMALLLLVRFAREGARHAGRPLRAMPAHDPHWWFQVVTYFAGIVGVAVIAAWILLAVSGRRRSSPSWLDLLGRLLGMCWIVLFVVKCYASLVYLKD
ncbi:hypothetical protein [Singulisphaera sp. PoT]|uniref:hypothetical protein n=1 Tax=Singulisphaera sp. PoT TaxID=3411797 RepID=UPI003BF4A8AA